MVLLRKLRKEKGISINQLAKETGVNRFTISNVENKQYKAATRAMKKLADYFGIKEPLSLSENVVDILQAKSCLNQKCPLNKQCYCQSDQVCNGAFCKNEKEVSEPANKVKFNSTAALFID